VTLGGHVRSWTGTAWRHIPAGSRFDVLDFRFAGRGTENRWNEAGEPTLYLAGDEGVLLAEWGRHFEANRGGQLQRLAVERSTYNLQISIDQVLDLRTEEVCHALSIVHAPYCFADVEFARATSRFIRRTTPAQALFVPSLAFLDDLQRWCLVVFLEKFPPDPRSFIVSVTPCGPLRWG
jgi:RES domain-containing protein